MGVWHGPPRGFIRPWMPVGISVVRSDQNGENESVELTTDGVENNSASINPFAADELRRAQEADESIKVVLDWRKQLQTPPSWTIVQPHSEEVRILWGQWDSLTVDDGILYRLFYNTDGTTRYKQVVLPVSLRETFVRKVHIEFGHRALKKTLEAISRYAYFPNWRTFTQRLLARCEPCQRFLKGKPPRQAELGTLKPNGPMDILCVDLVGRLPVGRDVTGARYSYLLTCIDAYTR